MEDKECSLSHHDIEAQLESDVSTLMSSLNMIKSVEKELKYTHVASPQVVSLCLHHLHILLNYQCYIFEGGVTAAALQPQFSTIFPLALNANRKLHLAWDPHGLIRFSSSPPQSLGCPPAPGVGVCKTPSPSPSPSQPISNVRMFSASLCGGLQALPRFHQAFCCWGSLKFTDRV